MSKFDEFVKGFQEAVAARDRSVNERVGNMWKGPIGIEEQILIMKDDIKLAMWGIQRIVQILADERAADDTEGKQT